MQLHTTHKHSNIYRGVHTHIDTQLHYMHIYINTCPRIFLYMDTHKWTRIHIHTYIYTHRWIHMNTYTNEHTHTYTHRYIYTQTGTHTCRHILRDTCMCISTHIHMDKHTCTGRWVDTWTYAHIPLYRVILWTQLQASSGDLQESSEACSLKIITSGLGDCWSSLLEGRSGCGALTWVSNYHS